MLIGQYVQRLSGLSQFSPPFPRGGQGILLAVDVLSAPGGGKALVVAVEHKDAEDVSWASLGTISGIATTGVKTGAFSGCKEMLRLGYTVIGIGVQPRDTFYINVPAPTWRP